MKESPILDGCDRALLREVRIGDQVPARIPAECVGLSESAVLRRLRPLRRDGVIVVEVAVLPPAALDTPRINHLWVSLDREASAPLDAFMHKRRIRPEVRAARYVTGEADVALLRLASMEACETFMRKVFHDDPDVRAVRTIVARREGVGANVVVHQDRRPRTGWGRGAVRQP